VGTKKKRVKGGTGIAYVPGSGDSDYVYLLKGYKSEFYRYSVSANAWDTLPLAPAAKYNAGSWVAYDGDSLIYTHQAKDHGFYAFNVKTKTWGPSLTGMPLMGMMGKNKKSKDGGSGAWLDGAVYALKGGNTCEFWKYAPDSAKWTEKETMPQVGTGGKKKKVKNGAGITAVPNIMALFATKGNKTTEFWTYHPGTFLALAPAPERSGVMAERVTGSGYGAVISPNPLAVGYATLRYSLPEAGAATLRIYDVTGRTVLSRSIFASRSGHVGLDLRNLSAGVYLVKFSTESFTATHKLVVQ
jgi:hypothetical protein